MNEIREGLIKLLCIGDYVLVKFIYSDKGLKDKLKVKDIDESWIYFKAENDFYISAFYKIKKSDLYVNSDLQLELSSRNIIPYEPRR